MSHSQQLDSTNIAHGAQSLSSILKQESYSIFMITPPTIIIIFITFFNRQRRPSRRLLAVEAKNRLQSRPPSIATLPLEFLSQVAEDLDSASVILLSHTCKQLHFQLLPRLASSMECVKWTRYTHADLLKYIERDLPGHRLCERCLRFYKWRAHRHMAYSCGNHKYGTWSGEDYLVRPIPAQRTNAAFDLILRAHQRGSSHGLPTSWLSYERLDSDGMYFKSQARLRGQELIYATDWGQELDGEYPASGTYRFCTQALCDHACLNASTNWVETTIESQDCYDGEEGENNKSTVTYSFYEFCAYCTTDCRINLLQDPGRNWIMRANVWHSTTYEEFKKRDGVYDRQRKYLEEFPLDSVEV